MADASWYPVVSCDNHITEPKNLYQERIASKLKARAPRVESLPDGDRIMMDDRLVRWVGLEAMEEFEREERNYKGARYGTGRIGKFEVEARKCDLAKDDIQGEILYGFDYWMDQPDRDVLIEMIRIYNDWVHEFISEARDRAVANAMLPSWDVDQSIREAQRAVGDLGARALSIAVPYVGDVKHGYRGKEYDRLWATIAELGVPIASHIGTGGAGKRFRGPGFTLEEFLHCQIDAAQIILDFVASGVFERHPKLRFAIVEGGIGWAPWYLMTMDRMWEENGAFLDVPLSKPPSEYVKQQCLITFQDDVPGIRNLDVLESCVAWGSDYPHREGTFPRSREVIRKQLGHLPIALQRRICGENAARFFGLDLEMLAKKYGPDSAHHREYVTREGGSRRIPLGSAQV